MGKFLDFCTTTLLPLLQILSKDCRGYTNLQPVYWFFSLMIFSCKYAIKKGCYQCELKTKGDEIDFVNNWHKIRKVDVQQGSAEEEKGMALLFRYILLHTFSLREFQDLLQKSSRILLPPEGIQPSSQSSLRSESVSTQKPAACSSEIWLKGHLNCDASCSEDFSEHCCGYSRGLYNHHRARIANCEIPGKHVRINPLR